jgi:hypothetical protein
MGRRHHASKNNAPLPGRMCRFLSTRARLGRWVTTYDGWRPNLPDETANHFIELAVAGGAAAIITHKVRDIHRGELLLNGLQVHTPVECLEKTR